MTYRVELVQVMSGRVLGLLDVAGGRWSDDTLNTGDGSIEVEVAADVLRAVPAEHWAIGACGLCVSYRADDTAPWAPVACGPITEWSGDDGHSVTLSADASPLGILSDRVATTEWAAYGSPLAWAASVVELRGGSKRDLVAVLVRHLTSKPNGALPIEVGWPADGQAGAGIDLPAYDVASQPGDAVLESITQTIDGPDVRFRPVYRDGGARVVWLLEAGTPRLGALGGVEWDTTAPLSGVRGGGLTVDTAGTVVQRVYATGAGSGDQTLIRVDEDLTAAGMPLRERVVSDTSVTDPEALLGWARGVRAATGLQRQFSLVAAASDQAAPLWMYPPGASARLRVAGLLTCPDDYYRVEVLQRSGDLASDFVTIKLGALDVQG